MDNKNLIKKYNTKLFHPSMFEAITPENNTNKRTLDIVTNERKQKFTSEDITKLMSPGSFKLTSDDKKVSGSNTRHLFKNLYGETPLTFLFFSEKNVNNIQNLLRYIVNKEYNMVIDNQSVNELMIVMRSIFLEYSNHPKLINEEMSPEEISQLLPKYTAEVARLNEIVVNELVPKIVSRIQAYIDYLRDAGTQPKQIDKPLNVNVKGQKEYRSITQVLLGGNL